MIYRYARVSTDGQSAAAQVGQLRAAGCEKLFRETASGAETNRVQLRKAIARLEAGDAYTLVVGRPPTEADIQRFFGVSAPAVHQMVVTLANRRLISRQSGLPRSISLLVDPDMLPELQPPAPEPVKTSVPEH